MALITPRNPLAYPGGAPGINTGHIAAAKGLLFSGVASGNNMICLNNGSLLSNTGPLGSAMTALGPAVTNATGTSFLTYTAPNIPTNSNFVFAAIFMPTSSAPTGIIMTSDGSLGFADPQLTMSMRAFVPSVTAGPSLYSSWDHSNVWGAILHSDTLFKQQTKFRSY